MFPNAIKRLCSFVSFQFAQVTTNFQDVVFYFDNVHMSTQHTAGMVVDHQVSYRCPLIPWKSEKYTLLVLCQ